MAALVGGGKRGVSATHSPKGLGTLKARIPIGCSEAQGLAGVGGLEIVGGVVLESPTQVQPAFWPVNPN